jgi:uncharacterized protein (DUF342 family)
MTKTIKLSKQEEKETEILAKRILPKSDFEKVIAHDKIYYNALTQHLEFSVIKADILQAKVEEVLKNQTKEKIKDNIDMLCDFSKTRLDCLDTKAKQHIQQKLIEDKELHFKNVFLPQFNKECEEMKKNFTQTYKEAEEVLKETDKAYQSFVKKITYEMTWWNKTSDKDKKNDEYRIQLYKPLKRILSAYKKEKERIREENKYIMKDA